jgi:hypothetical protein
MSPLPRLLLSCFALAGLLAACTEAPAVATAGTAFDGVYQGENRVVRGSGFVCAPDVFLQSIIVRNGRFDYPFPVSPPYVVPLPVLIAADGSLAGQLQYGTENPSAASEFTTAWVLVRGRITGPTLDATVTDKRCTRHLLLQRQ